jgi:hypothetical protein
MRVLACLQLVPEASASGQRSASHCASLPPRDIDQRLRDELALLHRLCSQATWRSDAIACLFAAGLTRPVTSAARTVGTCSPWSGIRSVRLTIR